METRASGFGRDSTLCARYDRRYAARMTLPPWQYVIDRLSRFGMSQFAETSFP